MSHNITGYHCFCKFCQSVDRMTLCAWMRDDCDWGVTQGNYYALSTVNSSFICCVVFVRNFMRCFKTCTCWWKVKWVDNVLQMCKYYPSMSAFLILFDVYSYLTGWNDRQNRIQCGPSPRLCTVSQIRNKKSNEISKQSQKGQLINTLIIFLFC